jgi:transposase
VLRHAEEVSGNVAATCRYYGISRECYYGWRRRYQADGAGGIEGPLAPTASLTRATQAEVVEKIVWLRKHYHFGPDKIAMYLTRYHDVTISTSGVWRILKRLGMSRLPASQRYKRHTLGSALSPHPTAATRRSSAARTLVTCPAPGRPAQPDWAVHKAFPPARRQGP